MENPVNRIYTPPSFEEKFPHWKKLFDLRGDMPPETFFHKVWFNCFHDCGDIHFQLIKIGDKVWRFGTTPGDPEVLSACALTDELLIDNRTVLHRYCQVQKKGWEYLRYIDGRIYRHLKLPGMLRQAILDDSPEAFAIAMDMCGVKLSFSLLAWIIMLVKKDDLGNYDSRIGSLKILKSLLQDRKAFEKVIPLDEFLCLCTCRFFDDAAMALLETAEELYPGCIKNCRDAFGRNLLWYLVHNQLTAWYHPYCKLTGYLLEKGCDPDNATTCGLTWRYLTDNLTFFQKRQQIKKRYGTSRYPGEWGRVLEKIQPLWALPDALSDALRQGAQRRRQRQKRKSGRASGRRRSLRAG